MKIIADSALQLSAERIQELGIDIVEYPLFLNGDPYEVSISMLQKEKDKLRELILDKNNKVSTSGLIEPELKKLYKSYSKNKILSFHQSLKMSSLTASTLEKVKSDLPDIDLEIIDSHHMAAAYSVQVLEAAKALNKGKRDEELMEFILKNRDNTRHLGVIYDLSFLHRTGRIGLIKMFLGKTMRIIPLVGSSDTPGTLTNIGKARTFRQANISFLHRMELDMAEKRGKRLSAVMSYIGPHENEILHLKKLIEDKGWDTTIEYYHSNHSNMPHVGPDFYDIGYTVFTE